jgi:hypothetical protein
LNVDTFDLAIWESQFGAIESLAASVAEEASATQSESPAIGSASVSFGTNTWLVLPVASGEATSTILVEEESLFNSLSAKQVDGALESTSRESDPLSDGVETPSSFNVFESYDDSQAVDQAFDEWDSLARAPD